MLHTALAASAHSTADQKRRSHPQSQQLSPTIAHPFRPQEALSVRLPADLNETRTGFPCTRRRTGGALPTAKTIGREGVSIQTPSHAAASQSPPLLRQQKSKTGRVKTLPAQPVKPARLVEFKPVKPGFEGGFSYLDEEFGEDVLVTAKETTREASASATEEWKDSTAKSSATAAVNGGDNDNDDEELYGGVSIKLNAEPDKSAKVAPASSGLTVRAAGGGNGDDDDFDDDEDEEDIAIVLNNDSKGSKPTLRFTGGGANRYVRGSFAGGPQHVPSGVSHLHHKQGEGDADSIDDLAMFGGRRTAFDVDIDMLEDKPWRKPGVDISDYFNYGFDEHSWREYAGRQLRLRRDLAMEKTREQAARQAVSAASQPPVHDVKSMQGPPLGGGMPPRGAAFPGGNGQQPMQMGPGGSNNPQGEQSTGDANQQPPNGQWGPGGGMPPMGGMVRGPPGPGGMAGPHGAPGPHGFMPPPRGWHPGMGPPPHGGAPGPYMHPSQNWGGGMHGGPVPGHWGGNGAGRGPPGPWMSGPGPDDMGGRGGRGGRGGGRGGRGGRGPRDFDDRGGRRPDEKDSHDESSHRGDSRSRDTNHSARDRSRSRSRGRRPDRDSSRDTSKSSGRDGINDAGGDGRGDRDRGGRDRDRDRDRVRDRDRDRNDRDRDHRNDRGDRDRNDRGDRDRGGRDRDRERRSDRDRGQQDKDSKGRDRDSRGAPRSDDRDPRKRRDRDESSGGGGGSSSNSNDQRYKRRR